MNELIAVSAPFMVSSVQGVNLFLTLRRETTIFNYRE